MVFCALSTALIFVPFFWLFGVVQLQQSINRIVALGPVRPRITHEVQPAAEGLTGVRVAAAAAPTGEWADERAMPTETATRAERR